MLRRAQHISTWAIVGPTAVGHKRKSRSVGPRWKELEATSPSFLLASERSTAGSTCMNRNADVAGLIYTDKQAPAASNLPRSAGSTLGGLVVVHEEAGVAAPALVNRGVLDEAVVGRDILGENEVHARLAESHLQ